MRRLLCTAAGVKPPFHFAVNHYMSSGLLRYSSRSFATTAALQASRLATDVERQQDRRATAHRYGGLPSQDRKNHRNAWRSFRRATEALRLEAAAVTGRLDTSTEEKKAATSASSVSANFLHTSPKEMNQARLDDGTTLQFDAVAAEYEMPMPSSASNTALMAELGVLEVLNYSVLPPLPSSLQLQQQHRDNSSAEARAEQVKQLTPFIVQVVSAGLQSGLSSATILRHLSSAIAVAMQKEERQQQHLGSFLTMRIRLQLLQNEVARGKRHRRTMEAHLREKGCMAAASKKRSSGLRQRSPAGDAGDEASGEMPPARFWEQTTQNARDIVEICSYNWLQVRQPMKERSCDPDEVVGASVPSMTAAECQVLIESLHLCEVVGADDVAERLMNGFLASISALKVTEWNDDLSSWYDARAIEVYLSAIRCLSGPMRKGRGVRFERSYAYFMHYTAALGAAERARADENVEEQAGGPTAGSSSASSMDALLLRPQNTIRLIAALADSIDSNVQHFDMIYQLYRELLMETDVGYEEANYGVVSQAARSLLSCLQRIHLSSTSRLHLLEELYKYTMLNTSTEVSSSTDVRIGCLLASSAATSAPTGAPPTQALFNHLLSPSTRSIAFEEDHVGAATLSSASASADFQRALSFMAMRYPLTVDIQHALAAKAILSFELSLKAAGEGNGSGGGISSTSVYAILDLHRHSHHWKQQHQDVTATTMELTTQGEASRTFFLRLVALLIGIQGEASTRQQKHGADSSNKEGDDASRPSLLTPEAAAVLLGWEADLNQQQLPGVVVDLLLHVAIALHHFAANYLDAAQVSCQLLDAVHLLLHRHAAPHLPCTAVTVDQLRRHNRDGQQVSDAAGASTTILELPLSLRLRGEESSWPVEEQRQFLKDLKAKCLDLDAEVPLLKLLHFEDWRSLQAMHRRHQLSKRREVSGQNVLSSGARPEADSLEWITEDEWRSHAAAVAVLSPLAEAQLATELASAAAIQPKSLSTGATIPVAFRCPVRRSDGVLAVPTTAPDGLSAASYWLQLWCDAVEAEKPLSSYFERRVSLLLQQQDDEDMTEKKGAAEELSSSPSSSASRFAASAAASFFVRVPSSFASPSPGEVKWPVQEGEALQHATAPPPTLFSLSTEEEAE